MSIKHIHTLPLLLTHGHAACGHAACHEPAINVAGVERKKQKSERSVVKIWTGPLPSSSIIITSITSHTQSCFHVNQCSKPCSVRNLTGASNQTQSYFFFLDWIPNLQHQSLWIGSLNVSASFLSTGMQIVSTLNNCWPYSKVYHSFLGWWMLLSGFQATNGIS